MSLVIRLKKNQKKNYYNIIVVPKTKSPRSGYNKAVLGYYDPHTKVVKANIEKLAF